MGRRVSVVQEKTGVTAIPKNPFEQPCFSSFGGYYSASKGWFTLDHNLNVSNVMLGGNSGYGQWTCDNNSHSTEFSTTCIHVVCKGLEEEGNNPSIPGT